MVDRSQRSSKLLRSILLIVVLLGGGSAVAVALYWIRDEPPRRELTVLPPVVETVTLVREEVVESFAGYATVRPDRAANLAAEVSAAVIELVDDIEIGIHVQDGQTLIRLDDRRYRHNLARAQAQVAVQEAAIKEVDVEEASFKRLLQTAEQELRIAQSEKVRVADLFEDGLAAKKEYDFAVLAYQRARRTVLDYEGAVAKLEPRRWGLMASSQMYEAEAQLARLNIEHCSIAAPFEGVIEDLIVDCGDFVAPGSIMLRLIDPMRVEVPIQLPAAVYDRVSVGAPCRVESEGMRGVSWDGQVARIAPSVDEASRTFPVYVEVDNREQSQQLVPGTFVQATVRGPTHKDRLLVPRGAIREGALLVVVDGIVNRRSVVVERLLRDKALVKGDISDGDRVVLTHLDRLTDGSPVRLSDSGKTVSQVRVTPEDKPETPSP